MKKFSFTNLISDITSQDKQWRELAAKCADYYDHLQITGSRLKQLQACEYLDLIGNLIQPTVNSVLGHEEQRRVDWMITADDEDSEEVAEGLNQKLNEIMRLAEANRHCSEAYKHMIIKGVGWLHVRRNPDPFDANRYIIERVQTDEMYWDMRDRDTGLRNCRWMARRKFMDKDEAITLFPGHKMLIENACDGWTSGFAIGHESAEFEQRYSEWHRAQENIEHVLQGSKREQIAVYEVYYRVWEQAKVVRYASGAVEEYRKDDAQQLMALLIGQARGERLPLMKMRRKYFIGPHEISDDPSPHPHNHFPFVKFEGYTEDSSNVPYGIVRGMIDPQDAYNEAGFEILHILEHKRIIKEVSTTKMRDSELVSEMRRRDGVITTEDGKLGTLLVEKDWTELQALNGMQDKYSQQVRDFSGVYNSYTGRDDASRSGVAIASMAELGATTLSEINANYEYGRKKLAELVIAYIVEDMGQQPQRIGIRAGSGGQVRKTVHLNAEDEHGRLTNALAQAKYQVTLADVHSSVGYRQHLNMRVMEMFQVTTGDATMQRFLMEMAIETSELPNRHEVLEKWRKLNGISEDPEAQAQMQQQQQEQAAQAAQIAEKQAQASIAKDTAEAELDQARAAEVIAKIEQMKHEQEMQEGEMKEGMVQQARRMMAERELAMV